jgi:P-type E1-E2 ATPase
LERLAAVQQVFFDKTGTLTARPIRLQAITTVGVDQRTFMAQVLAIEAQSEHPLAQAIVSGLQPRLKSINHNLPTVTAFRALPGRGVTAQINQEVLWIGSRRLMAETQLLLPASLEKQCETWQCQGYTVIYVGRNDQVYGALALGEIAKPEAAATLAQLQAQGRTVTVLTGDDTAAGQRWQQLLQVPVLAEQRPEDKLAHLQAATTGVLMVGDGINDGPALAAATVGVAIGQGTDVAQAAADVILLNNDLRAIPWLLLLARATMRTVTINLTWAFAYNAVGLALAMTGYLQPVVSALLMVLSSGFVTSQALRLKRFPYDDWRLAHEQTPTNLSTALGSLPPEAQPQPKSYQTKPIYHA